MTTMHVEIIQNYFPVIVPNKILDADGFYISYNDWDLSIYGSDTTALVLGQSEHFYILNGDHRSQYRTLIPKGFKACLNYFKMHSDQISKYSENIGK